MSWGQTRRELAGSEIASQLGLPAFRVPQIDAPQAKARYTALFRAMQRGLVSACHSVGRGGLGVALAEMAIGGRCAACVDFGKVPAEAMTVTELLYAESASRLLVTVPVAHMEAFETLFAGQEFVARIGETTAEEDLVIFSGNYIVCSEPVAALVQAYKATLDW